jgi:lipid A disaccharide synthetase
MIRVKYASLVNIAVNAEIVPERLQEHCTPAAIIQVLADLASPEAMRKQRRQCAPALAVLRGDSGSSPNARAAQAVLQILQAQG